MYIDAHQYRKNSDVIRYLFVRCYWNAHIKYNYIRSLKTIYFCSSVSQQTLNKIFCDNDVIVRQWKLLYIMRIPFQYMSQRFRKRFLSLWTFVFTIKYWNKRPRSKRISHFCHTKFVEIQFDIIVRWITKVRWMLPPPKYQKSSVIIEQIRNIIVLLA